jgi:hypothetical protein
MRLQLLLVSALFIPFFSVCQDEESQTDREQQLETIAETAEDEAIQDPDTEEVEAFRKHPLNLNHASAEDLKLFPTLTELQVNNFIQYRNLFGMLIDIYELQCVPGWSAALIKQLLPYITIDEHTGSSWQRSFKEGQQTLILRYGTALERSAGFTEKAFLGSRDKLSVRYRFNYKNLLRWGISADKDAGEPFMKGAQKAGFDFYTFHLFLRKTGNIESLAIGDFTVNMGQGLIQWQSLAFKKSTAVLNIKRQSPVIRPYTGTGEFNFMRGAGITLKKNAATISFFASFRKLSGHLDDDTSSDKLDVSSSR